MPQYSRPCAARDAATWGSMMGVWKGLSINSESMDPAFSHNKLPQCELSTGGDSPALLGKEG